MRYIYKLARSEDGWNPYKYCGIFGYREDEEIGLMKVGARYYDPIIGRWIQKDPILDGFNWFVYCDNDPVNGVDPEGYQSVGEVIFWFGFLAAITGFGSSYVTGLLGVYVGVLGIALMIWGAYEMHVENTVGRHAGEPLVENYKERIEQGYKLVDDPFHNPVPQ
ncbi:RHS repeat-associated core domain-containing protein [bacterium]|nr:RHS repeat-associated core domain-containing protein [bacterium]